MEVATVRGWMSLKVRRFVSERLDQRATDCYVTLYKVDFKRFQGIISIELLHVIRCR